MENATPRQCVKIVANCHCLPLADAFALCSPFVDSDFIDVNFLNTPNMANKIDSIYEGTLNSDVLFSQVISGNFPRISTPELRARLGERLFTFTNIHFTGLHPDITYIGSMNRRVAGFFGDYHSKIVLYSFVNGLTSKECLTLFNGDAYEKLGYFKEFEKSANNLLSRDEDCDVRFAAQFIEMIQQELCLYTVNHLTGSVFLELAKQMALSANLEFINYSPSLFQNHLSTNYVWPIYREIAEYNKLRFEPSPYFISSFSRSSRSLNLNDFILGSYAAYAKADASDLAQMTFGLSFYKSFSEALGYSN